MGRDTSALKNENHLVSSSSGDACAETNRDGNHVQAEEGRVCSVPILGFSMHIFYHFLTVSMTW